MSPRTDKNGGPLILSDKNRGNVDSTCHQPVIYDVVTVNNCYLVYGFVAPSGCMHTHADLELYRFYRFIRSVTYLSILHRVRELLETELQCFNRQVHATS